MSEQSTKSRKLGPTLQVQTEVMQGFPFIYQAPIEGDYGPITFRFGFDIRGVALYLFREQDGESLPAIKIPTLPLLEALLAALHPGTDDGAEPVEGSAA